MADQTKSTQDEAKASIDSISKATILVALDTLLRIARKVGSGLSLAEARRAVFLEDVEEARAAGIEIYGCDD